MNKKRILILNWRCPKNPEGGGAEKVTLIHAKAWIKNGYEVCWLSGKFPGSAVEEIIEGIKVYRYTSCPKIYFWAPLIYWFKFGGGFDLVIDQIHGFPFLVPLWAFKSKKLVFIHEVAQEIWDQMLLFPLNILGKLYEKSYFRLFYKRTKFLTVSKSTNDDLVRFGIPEKNIKIISNGVDLAQIKKVPKKENNLTLIYVSRLVQMKGIEDAIKVFAEVYKTNNFSRFWIVGSGSPPYKNCLKQLTVSLGVEKATTFFGYVSETKKVELLQKAHFLVHTSIREGFGLVVVEANSQGTPAIVYNSPGLRDLVKNGVNGFQVEKGDIPAMAKKIIHLSNDPKKYSNLVKSSINESKKYNWDLMTRKSLNYLKIICE